MSENKPIDGSRSGVSYPFNGNGSQSEDNTESLEEVLTAELPEDPLPRKPQPKSGQSLTEQLEEMRSAKQRAEDALEKKQQEVVELARLISGNHPTEVATESDDPYPGWNPSDPKSDHPYSGMLYRIDSKKIQLPIEPITDFDFSMIALHYGPGTYMIRLLGNKGDSFRFILSNEFFRTAVKNNKDLYTDILREKSETEALVAAGTDVVQAARQPQVDPLFSILQSQSDRSIAMLEKLATKDSSTGASSKELREVQESAYKQGRDSQNGVIESLKFRIDDLVRRENELKEKVELLQVKLGEMPGDEDEEDELPEEKEPEPYERLISMGEKVIDLMAKHKTTEAPKQIAQEQAKVQYIVMNSDQLKKILIKLFETNKPIAEAAYIVQEAINKFSIIEKSFIEPMIKNNPADMVVGELMKYFMPDASPQMQGYIKQIINHIKQPKG